MTTTRQWFCSHL